MTSKPDRIFFALGGTNPLGYHDVGDLVPPDDGTPWSDTLKLSNCQNGTVVAGRVVGGQLEDCLDVNNHCADLVITADRWEPRGDYLATIKGGSKRIVMHGTVVGHGRVCDVDLGNFSDQSDDITGPISLNLLHETGDVIVVRRLNAMDPILLNEGVQRYRITRPFPVWGWARGLWARGYSVLKRVGLA